MPQPKYPLENEWCFSISYLEFILVEKDLKIERRMIQMESTRAVMGVAPSAVMAHAGVEIGAML